MRILTLAVAMLATTLTFAQKDFEGTIQYEIEYEDLNDQMKQMEAMLPKEMTVQIKDGYSKTTQPNAMGGETVVISEIQSGESITLMDMMGNKVALRTKAEDLKEKQEEADVEIEYLDETKEIAGYDCKKAIITAGDGSEIVVFYTEELPSANVGNQAQQIDGFPMQMEISQEMFTMISSVSSVEKGKVKKIKMEVPEGFKEMTQEELQNMMQGGGQ
jgi:GLPGLI family protein